MIITIFKINYGKQFAVVFIPACDDNSLLSITSMTWLQAGITIMAKSKLIYEILQAQIYICLFHCSYKLIAANISQYVCTCGKL